MMSNREATPTRAGWPTDPEARRRAYLADHAVAVVYPPFAGTSALEESPGALDGPFGAGA